MLPEELIKTAVGAGIPAEPKPGPIATRKLERWFLERFHGQSIYVSSNFSRLPKAVEDPWVLPWRPEAAARAPFPEPPSAQAATQTGGS